MRKAQIKKALLEVLDQCDGYALPESTLRSHVKGLLRPVPDDEEWADAVEALERYGQIVSVPNALDEDLKQWSITEKGKVLLLQAP